MTLNFILNGRPTELEVSPDKRLLDLLRDRSRPLKARLRDFLLITGEAQQLLDSENMAELDAFCTGSWAISTETDAGSGSWEAAACQCLQDLEILEPDWLALLKQWEQAPELPGFAPQDPEKLERIADYLDCSVDYLLGRTDNPAVNR